MIKIDQYLSMDRIQPTIQTLDGTRVFELPVGSVITVESGREGDTQTTANHQERENLLGVRLTFELSWKVMSWGLYREGGSAFEKPGDWLLLKIQGLRACHFSPISSGPFIEMLPSGTHEIVRDLRPKEAALQLRTVHLYQDATEVIDPWL